MKDNFFETIGNLLKSSFSQPAQVANRLKSLPLSQSEIYYVAALVIVLHAILTLFTWNDDLFPFEGVHLTSTKMIFLQSLSFIITVLAIFYIGKIFGGTGTLNHAFLLISWSQLLMLILQVIQIILSLVFLPLTGFFGLGIFIFFIWVTVCFVMQLHGFISFWKTFLGCFVSFFGLIFLFSTLLMVFGLFPTDEMANGV